MTDDLKPLGDVLLNLPAVRTAKKVNTLSRVHRRLIEPLEDDGDDPRLAFQHTVFCQTGLPYRNPGDDVRVWQRAQGRASLRVEAGAISRREGWQEVGLPWGVKPRLILAHLNAEALRQGKAEIEIESSLTAFVQRIRGFQHGREIRAFKEQLGRLSAATIRLAVARHEQPVIRQVNTQIITEFDLWLEKDERQRVLWPTTIKLAPDYFASLQAHAMPLYEDDLAALAHSALAIDLYSWLAQRLHRITPMRPAFVTWAALKEQFGPDYHRMDTLSRSFGPPYGKCGHATTGRGSTSTVKASPSITACRRSPSGSSPCPSNPAPNSRSLCGVCLAPTGRSSSPTVRKAWG